MFGAKAEGEVSLTQSLTLDFIEGHFTDLTKLASFVAHTIYWRSVLFACVLQRTRVGGRI